MIGFVSEKKTSVLSGSGEFVKSFVLTSTKLAISGTSGMRESWMTRSPELMMTGSEESFIREISMLL